MGTVPFALSIHNFVHSVGADAGFASILGLAVLVLLYFAQARETATLRNRLEEANGRVGNLESRLVQIARVAVPVAPPVVPAPAGAVPARPGAARAGSPLPVPPDLAPLPGAPVGVAAPALTSATKLIPSPALVPGRSDVPAAVPLPAVAAASAAASATVGVGAAAAAPPAGAGSAGAPDDTIFAPPPMTAAAGGNGHAGAVPPPILPRPVPPSTAASSSASIPPRVALRDDAGATIPPRRPIVTGGAIRERSRARRVLPFLIGLGAVAVVAVALIVITGSSGTTLVKHPPKVAGRGRGAKAAVVVPTEVTVAVLNGTAVNNVAHNISAQLSTAGYKPGAVTNAASQTFTTSVVSYTPGHKAAAAAVAKYLKLPARDVQPANQAALGVVCPPATPPTPCTADVIVTVGADLAGATPTT